MKDQVEVVHQRVMLIVEATLIPAEEALAICVLVNGCREAAVIKGLERYIDPQIFSAVYTDVRGAVCDRVRSICGEMEQSLSEGDLVYVCRDFEDIRQKWDLLGQLTLHLDFKGHCKDHIHRIITRLCLLASKCRTFISNALKQVLSGRGVSNIEQCAYYYKTLRGIYGNFSYQFPLDVGEFEDVELELHGFIDHLKQALVSIDGISLSNLESMRVSFPLIGDGVALLCNGFGFPLDKAEDIRISIVKELLSAKAWLLNTDVGIVDDYDKLRAIFTFVDLCRSSTFPGIADVVEKVYQTQLQFVDAASAKFEGCLVSAGDIIRDLSEVCTLTEKRNAVCDVLQVLQKTNNMSKYYDSVPVHECDILFTDLMHSIPKRIENMWCTGNDSYLNTLHRDIVREYHVVLDA